MQEKNIIFEYQESTQERTPEETLLLAMLWRAVWDIDGQIPQVKYSERARFKREALAWINSKSTDKWSFLWVCDNCDIKPQKVLDEIKKRASRITSPPQQQPD